MPRVCVFVRLLLVLIFAPALMAQNLIVNPGFEEPAIPGTSQYLVGTFLPGWSISGADGLGEIQRGAEGLVGEGRQWIELDTTGNTTIWQDVATVQGQWYRFTIMVAKRPSAPGESRYRVYWNGNEIGTASTSETSFSQVTTTVQATSAASRIAIEAIGTSDSVGDLLDYVELIPVDNEFDGFGYNYYVPQIASGGGWRTSMFITSADDHPALAPCWRESWYRSNAALHDFREGCLGVAATEVHEVSGAGGSLVVGWVRVRTDRPARVVAIYRGGAEGFEAAVSGRDSVHRMVAPFDQTGGYRTGIAVANPGSARIYLRVTIRDTNGTVRRVDTGSLSLEPNAHAAFFLDERWLESRNIRGQIEVQGELFNGAPAEFAIIGLRFAPNGAFSTLPY